MRQANTQTFTEGVTESAPIVPNRLKAGGYEVAHSVISGPMFLEHNRPVYESIAKADLDPTISAHLIDVSTGGGGLSAGQEGYNIISSLTKPVLVHTDYMCSAGVMATATANEIMLKDGMSMVGSVGILGSFFKPLIDAYPELFLDIFPDSSSRKREEFKSLIAGDQGPMKAQLGELDKAFMGLVKKHRPKATKEARSGAVFTGRDAINEGLADSIGNRTKALKRLSTLIKHA